MALVIGIDAGGTKTSGRLFDDNGAELRHAVTGAGNIVSAGNNAIENIANCISQLNPDGEPIELLILGMAGVTAGDKVDFVSQAIAARFPEVEQIKVLDDAQLGMAAALKGQDGIFIIAGTGSIALAIAGDDSARVGGMGHILGDEGSGYWIGKQLFKKLVADYNSGSFSPLSKRLLAKEGTRPEDTPKLVGKFYTLSKDDVALYSMWVAERCHAGDADACAILTTAGAELAKLVRQAAAKLDNRVNLVATSGSVLNKNQVVRHAFLAELPEYQILSDEFTPEKAAYYLLQDQ